MNYEGGVLQHPARVAIHFTHRLGALVGHHRADLGSRRHAPLASGGRRAHAWRHSPCWARSVLQLLIGASMVLKGFPLALATAHNAGAALLLLATIALFRAVRA